MTTTLLIDADILAYKAASLHQDEIDTGDGDPAIVTNFEEACDFMDRRIGSYLADLKASTAYICLTDDDHNFRKDVLSSYKGQRTGPKPVMLADCKQYLEDNYVSYRRPSLEADDVMGILSTHPKIIPGKKIIVSEDKDMKTIPGWLYNPDKDEEPWLVSEEEADWWFLYQTITGDTTDNYKGCVGFGDVAARAALDIDPSWTTVLILYAVKKKTEEDALVQARCARILRHTDYDFKNKEVILWTP